MPITTERTDASFDGRGPVHVYAHGEWKREGETAEPLAGLWVHEGFPIEVSSRHPSFPERICVMRAASRHPFGFWQIEAEFAVERYEYDSATMESRLIPNAWGAPVH